MHQDKIGSLNPPRETTIDVHVFSSVSWLLKQTNDGVKTKEGTYYYKRSIALCMSSHMVSCFTRGYKYFL
jgi:hypothetical protein